MYVFGLKSWDGKVNQSEFLWGTDVHMWFIDDVVSWYVKLELLARQYETLPFREENEFCEIAISPFTLIQDRNLSRNMNQNWNMPKEAALIHMYKNR